MWSIILPAVCSIIASSGFWSYVTYKSNKKDIRNDMLLGLGHDRIVYLGMQYIDRGYITQDEYENLYEYLYIPYKKLGGNGSAQRIMNEIEKLEIRKTSNK